MAPSSRLIEIVDGLAAHAERPALVAFAARERREWSYGQLARTVRELAAGLASAGLEPGARAALFAPDGPEWIASALAVIRAGAVVVPLDAQFTDESLAHTLTDSAARLVFTTADRASRVASLAPAARIVLLDTPEGRASWRAAAWPGGAPSRASGRRPRRPVLHLGHDGTAKGRPAESRQPDLPDQHARRHPARHDGRPRVPPPPPASRLSLRRRSVHSPGARVAPRLAVRAHRPPDRPRAEGRRGYGPGGGAASVQCLAFGHRDRAGQSRAGYGGGRPARARPVHLGASAARPALGHALVPRRSRADRPQAPAADLGRRGAGAGRRPEARRPGLGRGQRIRADRDLADAHAQPARRRSPGQRGAADPGSHAPHRLPNGPGTRRGRDPGAGPRRVHRVSESARQDAGGLHRRRLVPDGRSRLSGHRRPPLHHRSRGRDAGDAGGREREPRERRGRVPPARLPPGLRGPATGRSSGGPGLARRRDDRADRPHRCPPGRARCGRGDQSRTPLVPANERRGRHAGSPAPDPPGQAAPSRSSGPLYRCPAP